jgi:hypothetical protein
MPVKNARLSGPTSLPPHLRTVTNNQSSHIAIPPNVEQTIGEIRTVYRRKKKGAE